MSWSFDISAAPRDSDIWLATKCGKVIKSYWIDKFGPGRWAGLGTKEQPIAWQAFVVPEHPGIKSVPVAKLVHCSLAARESDESAVLNSKTDAAISRPGFASLDRPEIENRSDQEGSESESSGGMQDEIAIHPATNRQAETSRQTSPVVETESARSGAGASKVVCPALINDVGGEV